MYNTPMSSLLLMSVFTLLLLPGVVGVIVPILPGLAYMLVMAVLFGFIDKFAHLHGWELAVLGGIALLSLIIDYASGMLGARWGGASKQAMLFGFLGLLVGLALFPPFGSMIGLFLGVLIAEIRNHKDERQAVRAATGSLLGSISGMVINVILAVIFIGLFVLFAVK